MLSSDERAVLLAALSRWADTAPPEPVIGSFDGDPDREWLTPRELVEEVRHDTATGDFLVRVLEFGVRREGLANVARRLEEPPLTWAATLVDRVTEQLGHPFAWGVGPVKPGDVVRRHELVGIMGKEAPVEIVGTVYDLGAAREQEEPKDKGAARVLLSHGATWENRDEGQTVTLWGDDAWLLELVGLAVRTLPAPMADAAAGAAATGRWDPAWALITEVGTARRATLAAGRSPYYTRSAPESDSADSHVPRQWNSAEALYMSGTDVTVTCRAVEPDPISRGAWRPTALPVEEALESLARGHVGENA